MAFDPKRHTIRVQGGREYLPVSARLVWFRNDHPDWGIVTQPVEINLEKQYAIFQCSIFNAEGKLMATATKMENVKGFGDYLEKAETGSVGRALAYCGYGTQFAPELEEGGRFSDAPMAPSSGYGPNGGGNGGNRFARQAAPFGGGNGNNGGNFRPANNNPPAGNEVYNGGNGGNGNSSPRPLSPRPMASRPEPTPEPTDDESPFDDEMPRAEPPRAEASRPYPPRGDANPFRPQPARSEAPRAEPPRAEARSETPAPRDETPTPTAPASAVRPAAPGNGIQRVREPEPETHGYDTDEDDEDPFGDEDALTPSEPVAKAAPRPATPPPASDAPAKPAAPRSGVRPLGEEGSEEDLPAPPLVANKCSADGCPHTLTPSQMTMSQNKFGRPLCLLHQREATPLATAGGSKGRPAKSGTETLL